MLVGTLTNILVKKFLGRKFIPRFAKYLIKFPLELDSGFAVVNAFAVLGLRQLLRQAQLLRQPQQPQLGVFVRVVVVVYNHWTGMVEWNSGMCSVGERLLLMQVFQKVIPVEICNLLNNCPWRIKYSIAHKGCVANTAKYIPHPSSLESRDFELW